MRCPQLGAPARGEHWYHSARDRTSPCRKTRCPRLGAPARAEHRYHSARDRTSHARKKRCPRLGAPARAEHRHHSARDRRLTNLSTCNPRVPTLLGEKVTFK